MAGKKPQNRTEVRVVLTDYVPYVWNENLDLKSTDFTVPESMLPDLGALKNLGVKLEYDGSKSQGIDIIHRRTGKKLGNVTVFFNGTWLRELCAKLTEIASDPAKHGLP